MFSDYSLRSFLFRQTFHYTSSYQAFQRVMSLTPPNKHDYTSITPSKPKPKAKSRVNDLKTEGLPRVNSFTNLFERSQKMTDDQYKMLKVCLLNHIRGHLNQKLDPSFLSVLSKYGYFLLSAKKEESTQIIHLLYVHFFHEQLVEHFLDNFQEQLFRYGSSSRRFFFHSQLIEFFCPNPPAFSHKHNSLSEMVALLVVGTEFSKIIHEVSTTSYHSLRLILHHPLHLFLRYLFDARQIFLLFSIRQALPSTPYAFLISIAMQYYQLACRPLMLNGIPESFEAMFCFMLLLSSLWALTLSNKPMKPPLCFAYLIAGSLSYWIFHNLETIFPLDGPLKHNDLTPETICDVCPHVPFDHQC